MNRNLLFFGLSAVLVVLVSVMVVAKIPAEAPGLDLSNYGPMVNLDDSTAKNDEKPPEIGYFQEDGTWFVRDSKGRVGEVIFQPIVYSRMSTEESITIAWEDGEESAWRTSTGMRFKSFGGKPDMEEAHKVVLIRNADQLGDREVDEEEAWLHDSTERMLPLFTQVELLSAQAHGEAEENEKEDEVALEVSPEPNPRKKSVSKAYRQVVKEY